MIGHAILTALHTLLVGCAIASIGMVIVVLLTSARDYRRACKRPDAERGRS